MTQIVDRFWGIAQSAHAETLRGERIYADSVSLQVFPQETLRARIRRALETMFQVPFVDDALTWDAAGFETGRGGVVFTIHTPFECQVSMTRRTTGSRWFGSRTYEVFERYVLTGIDVPGWQDYLTDAEDHACFASLRDLLARCPDRDAVFDMVSAIVIAAAERPRLSDRAPADTRQLRGVKIRARKH